jgi:crotonobetainyl-CoA:carnitine CoA-transferase CaiB-like acyl-CoA transferase
VATRICAENGAEVIEVEQIHRSATGSTAGGHLVGVRGHREWIDSPVALGRNATSIYQDLAEKFGFTHRHNSGKRFVAARKAREPERFDVFEALPGRGPSRDQVLEVMRAAT